MDETDYMHKMDIISYQKLLLEKFLQNIKKLPVTLLDINDEEEVLIAKKKRNILKLNECYIFIAIKDHKVSFPYKKYCRLINFYKLNIGIVSEKILDDIVPQLRVKSRLQQQKLFFEILK